MASIDREYVLRVFLSWSGARSREIARLLRDWLPDVMQYVKPWMSDVDIPTGSHWPRAIGEELSQSQAGIICVTRENQTAPWLLFEAGALAKSFREHSRICIYLLGMRPVDLASGPLTLYQAAQAEEKENNWKLVSSLNDVAEEERLDKERLRRAFERSWNEFSEKLEKIRVTEAEDTMRRPDREVLDDVLAGIRELQRVVVKVNPRPVSGMTKYVAPQTYVEEQIADIWKSVLGYDRIGIFDNFFELGGDSILAIQLIARMRTQMQAEVGPVDLFEHPTVHALAKVLHRRKQAGDT